MTYEQERTLLMLIAMCIAKECLCDVYARYTNGPCLRCQTLTDVKALWPTYYKPLMDEFEQKGTGHGV